MSYDFAVIGAGMIGSSCAKYLSGFGHSVVLIGPSENNNKIYHGAWHDEGRICRVFDSSPYWMELAVRSIERYRSIEKASGISFFTECGYIAMTKKDGHKSPELLPLFHHAAKATHITGNECWKLQKEDFGYMDIPKGFVGYWQPFNAGHISPRAFVRAQQKIAAANMCRVIDDSVRDVVRRRDGGFQISFDGQSEEILTGKVVLAPGAWVNFLPFLQELAPDPRAELDVKLITQTVAYLEISKEQAESAEMQSMPTVVTSYTDGLLDGTYILPPIKYPNGKYYLKLGHHDKFEKEYSTFTEVRKWYKSGTGNKVAVKELKRFAKKLFPGLEVLDVHGGSCCTVRTPKRRAPFVDEISDGAYLAVGGCGYGAKSADEIGRIAAFLSSKGEWSTPVPRDAMEATWRLRKGCSDNEQEEDENDAEDVEDQQEQVKERRKKK